MTTLFVGLTLDEAVTDVLRDALGPVWREGHDVAWTRPGGWHVTLAYLGPVAASPAQVAAVIAPVAARQTPPTLALREAASWFDRAAVVDVIDPNGWCVEVGRELQSVIAAADLPVVRREVAAHVTLCRRRGRRSDDRGRGLTAARISEALADIGAARWRPEAVSVMTSVTGDGPATYPVVASVPLGTSVC